MALNNDNNDKSCKCTTPEYELILNEQGPQGRQGEKGDAGFTPIISVKDNTPSNYTLNILTQDGQITTPNLKANLPAGGATGQVLTKNSGEQDDCSWQNLPASTIETEGIARLATEADFETTEDTEASDNTIVTPALFNSKLTKQSAKFVTTNTIQSIEADKAIFSNLKLPYNSTSQKGSIITNASVEEVNIPIIEPYDSNGSFRIGAAKEGINTNAQNGFDINNNLVDGLQGVTYYEQGQKGKIIADFNLDKYVKAGDNVTIDKGADGSLTINSTGGGVSDITSFYQLDYGTESRSIPVTFSDNNITIKSGIPITTPNGTFQYTSDLTYEYNFETERTIFAYKNDLDEDYYNMVAVYYGGSQPATNPEGQIAWFDNNVWKIISATGEITTFSTQLITPIAKVYLNGNNVKSIDYASYYKIDISNPTPSNMVTTDTTQTITGTKTFVGGSPLRLKNTSINKIATPFRLWENSIYGDKILLGDCPDEGASTSGLPVAITVPASDKTIYKAANHDLSTFVPVLDKENFSSVAPTGNLKYWTGTEAAYTGLTTKDADTLYRTTDTNKVYLGTIQIGGQ